MSTQITPVVADVTPTQEFKDVLSIVELEERFEMTAASEDSARCMISLSAAE